MAMRRKYNIEAIDRCTTRSIAEVQPEDITRLAEIDIECFGDAYEQSPVSSSEVGRMLHERLSNAGELMIKGVVNGKIEGFMTCMKTSLDAEDIKSWEETTNHGTLQTTFDKNGKNFYVVNLTVTPNGSANHIGSALVANMIARLIEHNAGKAYLLGRIPGFKDWLTNRDIDPDIASNAELDALADEYAHETIIVDGVVVTRDPVLRRLHEFGTKNVRVIRNGFDDAPSLNYSVLCEFNNPLAKSNNILTRKVAAKALACASQHPSVIEKMF